LALSTGACDALLVRDFDRLRDAFGQAAGGLVEIEIRGR
jgi:hypothetical protein